MKKLSFGIAILVIIEVIIITFILGNFMNNSIDYYEDTKPEIDVREYFNGPIEAWGIVQDWRGRVVKKFDIKMIGKWDGDNGTLTEHFAYYDGKTQQRVWNIKRLGDDKYEGTASDIIGSATGETSGSVAKWSYVMDLPVDDTTYHIKFDDWMWAMNDGVVINRSYLKKFGFKVGELTIFMKKQNHD